MVMADKVAVLGGQGLGDNLLEMVLAKNAHDAGLRVTVFCSRLCQLEKWFPRYHIVPSLTNVPASVNVLSDFQYILWPDKPWDATTSQVAAHWIAYGTMYTTRVNRAENMRRISSRVFAVEEATIENGIRAPEYLLHRRHSKRVCIHPTSAEVSKNWLPRRFLALASRLRDRGYEVVFIMNDTEVKTWYPVIGDRFPLLGFTKVGNCAAFLYESGFFIGNDSGGGHLSSCLNIPTLSLHGRKGKARTWQPAWGRVEVVTPRINVMGGSLRQNLWKYFLSVSAVERGFNRLLEQKQ